MSQSHATNETNGSAVGIKLVALVLVLGVIALIADVSLVSPKESLLPYPLFSAAAAPVAAAPADAPNAAPPLAMIATASAAKPPHRAAPAAATAVVAGDPSVPAAATVALHDDEPAPANF
jgi:hypothetical protein